MFPILSTICIIVLSLIFSAFFSGIEIAYVSADRLKFELDRQKNTLTNNLLSFLFDHPQDLLSTILVGNNIALVIYGLQMAILLDSPLRLISENAAFLTISQTILSTLMVLFAGEYLQKTIFRINPYFWLRHLSPLLLMCYILLWPVSKFTSFLSRLFLYPLGYKNHGDSRHVFSRADLYAWFQQNIEHSKPENIESEVQYFRNALDFSSVRLKDCLIPRNEVVALEENTDLSTLRNTFIESGLSKIVIFRNTIDNVLGYIHTSEMFRNARTWREHIINIPIVPETMPANRLMSLFIKEKCSMAVVVDEFGGTAGIVTREDIVEEIVGEIEDEHDSNSLVCKRLNSGEFVFSGRMEIDTINERFGLGIPDSDDYVTIAGFILQTLKDFPKVNEEFDIGRFHFKILQLQSNKIQLLNLRILQNGSGAQRR